MGSSTLEEKLKNHPELHKRLEAILDIAEGKNTGDDTANTVEEMAIIELQKLGLELMKKWAEEKSNREVNKYKDSHPDSRPRKKKETSWHTSFGIVTAVEVVLTEGDKSIRPFLEKAAITPRGCSLPLQRRVVDFASDVPFSTVPAKLREHYGIELCPEGVRRITLKHAKKAGVFMESLPQKPKTEAVRILAEADGSMIPIVTVDKEAKENDLRKTRKVKWREARLCHSRNVNSVTAIFRATLKGTDETGDKWFLCGVEAGFGDKTEVHCIGDGARWINDQADRVFGAQGSFLIDFYHVSGYLAKAGEEIDVENPKSWLKEQQYLLRSGNLYRVLQNLEIFLYGDKENKESGSAYECYNYLVKRVSQLDYLGAILKELPIGSGEIESGHRHVIQKRMKRAGMWWKEENAEEMLQLLTLRSNDSWRAYWDKQHPLCWREAA